MSPKSSPRSSASLRPPALGIGLLMGLALAPPLAVAGGGIAGYFGLYYRQQVVNATYHGPLDFLRDAAATHRSAERLLRPGASRRVTLDPGNGYLRIDDSADTDQLLRMALYRRAGGRPLLVVAASNCADACSFSVEFFVADDGRLRPIAADAVVPAIAPGQFVRPGHSTPKALAGIAPRVNYLPARRGTALTLAPWYGYEVEAQMDGTTRGAIRDLVLAWDRRQGRFVLPGGGP